MFSSNPYLRTLGVMSYVGIILGAIIASIGAASSPAAFSFGLLALLVGFLSVLAYLVVGGLTWKRTP